MISENRIIPALLSLDSAELVAVMDKNPTVAARIGEKFGIPHFLTEEEMYKSVECDAVYIATPVFAHKEQALNALSHSKHVFLEKPVAPTAEDARELVEAFRAAGKQLSIGYMMKFHNLHTRAKEMLASGAIGKVVSVRAHFSCWYPDIPDAWRQTWALGGGGSFMDMGVHSAELIEYILGEKITDVKSFCETQLFNYEVEDSAVVIFKTESGTLGLMDSHFAMPDATCVGKLEIYGSEGSIILTNTLGQVEGGTLEYKYAPQEGYAKGLEVPPGTVETYIGEGGNLYVKQLSHFTNLVTTRNYDYTWAEVAAGIQELVTKIYADAGVGK